MAESHTAIFDPAKVWSYSTRELTQAKFPFWEELVFSGDQFVDVAAGGTDTITIQPGSGEDWLIYLHLVLDTAASGSYIQIERYYSGPVPPVNPTWAYIKANSNYPSDYITLEWFGLINSSYYPRIRVHNAAGDSKYLHYRYMAFNLGTKKVEVQPMQKVNLLPIEEKAETIPKILYPLKNRIVIRRDFPESWGKPVLAVKLVDGKPLAKLPNGHIVERLDVIVPADRLIEVIQGIKAGTIDPHKTGWADLLRPWKSKLGLRW